MPNNVCFAQISDCHLYADKKAKHHGAEVFSHLCLVLQAIKARDDIEFIVFTGDLTQDHSEASYQLFVEAVNLTKLSKPIYYLAGNHDEFAFLDKHLKAPACCADKTIELDTWQIQLINSKSDTPSGTFLNGECERLLTQIDNTKHQLLMMHHHPVDVGYFIDQHGLKEQQRFYQCLDEISSLKALACGHVHNAIELTIARSNSSIPVFTCPATSIQFDKKADTVSNAGLPPGYRIFSLKPNGELISEAIFCRQS